MTTWQLLGRWLYRVIFDKEFDRRRIDELENLTRDLNNDWWNLNRMQPRIPYTPRYNTWLRTICDVEYAMTEIAMELDLLVYGPDNR